MTEIVSNDKKLYAGKFETAEALEDGYNNSIKSYHTIAQEKKDYEAKVLAYEAKEKSAKEAHENGIKEMGESYDQLKEYVSKNYPVGTHDAIMDKITVDPTARTILIQEREAKLNTTTPGINGVASGNSSKVSEAQMIELAKAAFDPANRHDETLKQKFLDAAELRAKQLGLTDNDFIHGVVKKR